MSLYNKYRPKTFDELKGDPALLTSLKSIDLKETHTFLFVGDSGSGKTSSGRIIASMVGATDADIFEINGSDKNGVDDMRDVINILHLKPIGKATVIIFDEFQRVTKDAQNILLKPLEDCPKYVYFIICTTEPGAILPTIKSRCTSFTFRGLTEDDIFAILKSVKKQEGFDVSVDELLTIASAAKGNARQALLILKKVAGILKGERLGCLQGLVPEENKYVIDLCRTLYSPGCTWNDLKGMLASLKEQNEEPEKIRRAILGYGQAIILKRYDEKIYKVMKCFRATTYDSGFPSLVLACLDVVDYKEAGRF